MFLGILLFLSWTTLVNGQMDPSGCIADNITLTFNPAIDQSRTVSSYTWNKDIGPKKDPSFAKFEPATSEGLLTYMDDIQGRIFHYPEEVTTLHITNLIESDAAKYTLVVRYVNFDGNSPEDVVNLSVKDVCFEEPKQDGKCAITTCFTGANGVLKTPLGKEETVNGYKQVKVCEDTNSGNYSCCNAANKCQSLTLEGTAPVSNKTGIIVGISVAAVIVLVGVVAAILYFLKQKRKDMETTFQPTVEMGINQVPEKEPLRDEM